MRVSRPRRTPSATIDHPGLGTRLDGRSDCARTVMPCSRFVRLPVGCVSSRGRLAFRRKRPHDSEVQGRQDAGVQSRCRSYPHSGSNHHKTLERVEITRPRGEGIRRVERALHAESTTQTQDLGEFFPEVRVPLLEVLLPEGLDPIGATEADSHVGMDDAEDCRCVSTDHCVLEATTELEEIGPALRLVHWPEAWLARRAGARRAHDARRRLGTRLCGGARSNEEAHCDRREQRSSDSQAYF